MNRSPSCHVLVALTLLTASACGASPETRGTTPGARSEGPPSGGSNDNVPPTAASSATPDAGVPGSVEGRDVEGQILVSGPGFAPPILQGTGVAGGPTEGHSGPMGCTGYYPPRPQHVLKVGRTVPMLRVMADGIDRDLTLALRTPDGQWHCNDDSGDPGYGLNPAVDLTNASGEIEVYVGVFSDTSTGAQYTLGVTEDPNRYGSSMRPGGLAMPPQPPGGGGLIDPF
ncbi:MAG: hypothetical protein U0353_05695 [Sandaracinus sp.]